MLLCTGLRKQSCIFSADICHSHRDKISGNYLSEEKFFLELGAVLPNVKDWYGGRMERAKKQIYLQLDQKTEIIFIAICYLLFLYQI